MAEAQRRIDEWVAGGDIEAILNLSFLKLTSLPRLPDNLKMLYCDENKLTSLPILPDSLRLLSCSFNKLTSLPTLPNGLERLQCEENKLISLPLLPNTLRYLWCFNNKLTILPVLPNTLRELWCFNNKLTILPVLPNGLEILSCNNNKLIRLPTLPQSLKSLSCENNNLPEIYDLEESENIDDDGTNEVINTELRYIARIRKLQKSKTNITNTIKSHSTEKKRNVFANTTFKNMPKNVVKKIANYMNEEDLENININSLKPKNVKRGETRKLKKV